MNHIKKVLFFTASTIGGGAERMLFNIINALDNNHKSHLIITSNDKIPGGVRIKAESLNLNKKNARNAFWRILKSIRNIDPDYVFTTSSNIGYMLILVKLLLRGRFKVIIRCAVSPSEIIENAPFKGMLLKYSIKMTYNKCDLLIAQTPFMKQDLVECYGVKAEKIQVIRNIIDKAYLSQKSDEYKPQELNEIDFNIVASGALYSVKGFDLLIKAVVPVVHSDSRVHLWIIGEERYEIGYREYLQNIIDNNGFSDNVKLLGYKANPYPYYKNADLFVMSSRKEGFPNVVLESLFLGTPVVATDCVDFSGVIFNGVNGFIVNKEDIIELRNGINRAKENRFDMNEYPIVNFDYNKLFS